MTPATPAAAAPTTRLTVDEFWDYCQRPENSGRLLELWRGEVVEMPRPTRRHGSVAGNIARILGNYSFARGVGYVVTNDSGVILSNDPGTVVGPDVGYFVDAVAFDDIHPKWGEDVPVLAVEVLSPTDKPGRVNQKIADYLKHGVRLVWLVDYEEKAVTVYRPHHTLDIVREGSELTGGDELPGFTCRVDEFFTLPKPPPPSA